MFLGLRPAPLAHCFPKWPISLWPCAPIEPLNNLKNKKKLHQNRSIRKNVMADWRLKPKKSLYKTNQVRHLQKIFKEKGVYVCFIAVYLWLGLRVQPNKLLYSHNTCKLLKFGSSRPILPLNWPIVFHGYRSIDPFSYCSRWIPVFEMLTVMQS